MTLFGWDASHYDGPIDLARMRRAKAEGIVFFTHKIGEGTGGADGYDGTALAAARDAGIEFIGGYNVVRSGPVGPQVDALIALADRDEPWWRDFPGWFWQSDLERWSYDNVPAETGTAFGEEIRRRTRKTVLQYASHGQYGDQLSDWPGPLWNADYAPHAPAGFAAMYPGDGWAPPHGSWRGGWSPYSGKAPAFLQFTSSAIIAGLTTCDANAYRGTVDQLRTLIVGAPTPKEDDMRPHLHCKEGGGYFRHDPDGLFWLRTQAAVDASLSGYGLTRSDLIEIDTLSEVRDAFGTVPGNAEAVTAHLADVEVDPQGVPVAQISTGSGPVDLDAIAAAAAKGAREGIDRATIRTVA